jgi:hypothetical protein
MTGNRKVDLTYMKKSSSSIPYAKNDTLIRDMDSDK